MTYCICEEPLVSVVVFTTNDYSDERFEFVYLIISVSFLFVLSSGMFVDVCRFSYFLDKDLFVLTLEFNVILVCLGLCSLNSST